MSPHAANSLVHDLVQMAQAFERLPEVQAELDRAQTIIEEQAKTIQRIEIKLIDRASEIDTLHTAVRNAEVARDDAELRFLEAEDRTEKALAFVRTMFGNAGALIQALEPPRAEPEVQTDPLPGDETIQPIEKSSEGYEGQSEPDPTASSQENGMSTAIHEGLLQTADTTNVLSPTDALLAVSEAVSAGPYANKLYINHPGWVSREDWLAGGGTDADYDYRG